MGTLADDLILKLRVIGRLADSDKWECKLHVHGDSANVQYTNPFSFLTRWFTGDSRIHTAEFVKKTISHCKEYVDLKLHSPKADEYLSEISEALYEAIKGIERLKHIYGNTSTVVEILNIEQNKCRRIIESIKPG